MLYKKTLGGFRIHPSLDISQDLHCHGNSTVDGSITVPIVIQIGIFSLL